MSEEAQDPQLVALQDVGRLVHSAATLTQAAPSFGLNVASVQVRVVNGVVRLVIDYTPAETRRGGVRYVRNPAVES